MLVDVPSVHGFTTYSSVWEVSGADFKLPVVCDPIGLGHNRILRELSILIINNAVFMFHSMSVIDVSWLHDRSV